MPRRLPEVAAILFAVVLIGGCATSARELMPTPTLYQLPDGQPVFDPAREPMQSPDLDLLFITTARPRPRSTPRTPCSTARNGPSASPSARPGSVSCPDWTGRPYAQQSQLAERTREVNLELGEVREIGAFPRRALPGAPDRAQTVSCCGIATSLCATSMQRPAPGRGPAPPRDSAEEARFCSMCTASTRPSRPPPIPPRSFATFSAGSMCAPSSPGRPPSTGNFLISYTTTTESGRLRRGAPEEEHPHARNHPRGRRGPDPRP
jgi:hypothetical protein